MVLEDFIRAEFSLFTIDEFKLAFKTNILSGNVIEHFQNFTPDYVAKVMTAYKSKANEVRKMLKPVEEEKPLPTLSEQEIIDYSYNDWLSHKNFEKIFNYSRVFSIIKGSFPIDREKVIREVNKVIEYKKSKMHPLEIKQFKATLTDEVKEAMCKKYAVNLYFKSKLL